jgi:hypothetical protein
LGFSASCSFALGESSTDRLSRAFTLGLGVVAESGSIVWDAQAANIDNAIKNAKFRSFCIAPLLELSGTPAQHPGA